LGPPVNVCVGIKNEFSYTADQWRDTDLLEGIRLFKGLGGHSLITETKGIFYV